MDDRENLFRLLSGWRIKKEGKIVDEGLEILQECRAKQASDTAQIVLEIRDQTS